MIFCKQHWRSLPSYSVLVDTRDRPEAQTTYVVEENIEIVTAVRVRVSLVYFAKIYHIVYTKQYLKRSQENNKRGTFATKRTLLFIH